LRRFADAGPEGLMEPLLAGSARLLPPATRRWLALRALRRGHRALPLVLTRGRDPVVLASLGMYRRARAVDHGRATSDPAQVWARVAAACGTGEADLAADLVQGRHAQLPTGWRRRVALALAPTRPAAALALLADAADPLAAVLLQRLGERERAAALVTDLCPSPDIDLLAGGLALEGGDGGRQAALINRALAAFDLDPLGRIDRHRPLTVRNLLASSRGPTRRGPLVSIVMAARDVATHVDAAIASILAQTWRDLELIVVDDGSRDDTAVRALAFASRDPRVTVLREPASCGPYVARNRGLRVARGEFVAFQDGDDFAHPRRIERQIDPLLRDRRLIATSSRWVRIGDDGRIVARQVWPLVRWNPGSPLFRRAEVLDAVGPFDEVRSGADCEHWARLCLAFGTRRVRRLGAPLVIGAFRPDSLTGAAATGFAAGNWNPDRLDYWEAWHLWHAELLASGRPARLLPDRPRPFPAPAALCVELAAV
jgi:hypothetical protein